MDNFSSHKVAGIQEAIEAVGAHLVYLSPYSPDFSPIENCWSKMKEFLRSIAARTYEDLDKAITEAFETVNLSDIIGWFKPQWLLYCSQVRTAIEDGSAVLLLHKADGTILGAVRFPHKKNKIAGLASKEEVVKFFHENFPEVGQLMPEEEAEAFCSRPISSVLTVRCNRYHYGDSVLLIGDAAHAVSPSIGQGCNSALEDVMILDNLLDEYSDNWADATEQFTIRRQPDAHALMELSNNSFPLSRGLLIEFLLRESFAKFMHKLFPKRFSPSLFELVFDSTIPYTEILNSHKDWISKVKKSNEKFLAAL